MARTYEFVPGLELSRRLFEDGVAPLLEEQFPALRYSAARLGIGSDVLGYDTPRSMDHDWGPRLQLFLDPADVASHQEPLQVMLSRRLPKRILGIPTHFSAANSEGTRLLAETDGPVNHRVEVWTINSFFEEHLAFDPALEPTSLDWLVWPQQQLLAMTAGAVYHDGLDQLHRTRGTLHYYPHDIWLYLLAAQWRRIAQEEHFVGRTGEVGDELGSGLLGARLVHDLMQLCFLMERRYAPYPKWFGTAFSELQGAPILTPTLRAVLSASTWQERERHLGTAYEAAADMHNALNITPPLETQVRFFHDRPFRVIEADRFAAALRAQIKDPGVAAMTTNIGSIDQFSHSTDLRSYPRLHKKLQSLYK